ncbi:Fc.00g097700.m01.CDS01 [Cosmosporella sp. VM-42]
MPNVYLSALCPFLARFGFSDIANQWQLIFQNTDLYAPAQTTDAMPNAEVVGPLATAYLHQIATFRLARREVTDEERKADSRTAWSLFPSAPPSPLPEQARLPVRTAKPLTIQPQYQETGFQMLALARQSQRDGIPNHVSPMMVRELTQDSGAAEASQLDQEQYFRMAEEITEYMTWDLSLPLQFDFRMEDCFSTRGQIE